MEVNPWILKQIQIVLAASSDNMPEERLASIIEDHFGSMLDHCLIAVHRGKETDGREAIYCHIQTPDMSTYVITHVHKAWMRRAIRIAKQQDAS